MMRAVIAVLGLCLVLVGCGKKSEEAALEAAIEGATGKKIDIDTSGDTFTFRGEEGEIVVAGAGSAEVPADFPEDVFRCEGAVKASVKTPSGHQITVESSETVESIAAQARKKMSAGGWEEAMHLNQGGAVILNFTKQGGARTAMMQIMPDDGKTRVTITATSE
ncbi:MAG: hypothetical protein JXA90_13970 [Planctomycetes bacterium]|nr:hypothetical protein [Planctomycetota bacterium]